MKDITVIHIEDERLIRLAFARSAGAALSAGTEWHHFDGQDEEPIIRAIEAAAEQGRAVVYVSDRQIAPEKGEIRFRNGEDLWVMIWEGLSDDGRKSICRFISYCSSPGDEVLKEALPPELKATCGAIHKPLTVNEFFTQLLLLIRSL